MFTNTRTRERKIGKDILSGIEKNRAKTLIIHYSCESFFALHGRTPRVTSISVGKYDTGEIKSFSIHLQAQFNGLDFTNLTNAEYDKLELEMLTSYYDYIRGHKDHLWIHWKMANSNFGFEAIDNRYRILKGTPEAIEDDRKIDLSRVVGYLYGWDFEDHLPRGKLLNLVERNGITELSAKTGKEEADLFEQSDYLTLHMSTLRKVSMISTILDKAESNKLKTKSSLTEIYGFSPSGIYSMIRSSPVISAIIGILLFVLGAALEPVIQSAFGTADKNETTQPGGGINSEAPPLHDTP